MQFLKLSLVSVLSLTLLACGDDKKDSISDAQAEATAKAMVADVRDVYTAANLDDITTGGESFAEELNAAQMLGQDEASAMYATFIQAVYTIADAMNPNIEKDSDTEYSADGITVLIIGNTYSVIQEINGFAVNLNITGTYEELYEYSQSETPIWSDEENTSGSADIAGLNGFVSSANYIFSVTNGKLTSQFSKTNSGSYTDDYTDGHYTSEDISSGSESNKFSVSAAVKFEQLNDEKLSFSGNLDIQADVNDADDQTENYESDLGLINETVNINSTANINNLQLIFTGDLQDEMGSNIALSIKLNIKDLQLVFLNLSERHYSYDSETDTSSDITTEISGENAQALSNNAHADFEVKLELALAGIDKNTSLLLSGSTDAVDNGNIKLVFGFAGKTLTIAADSAKQQATLSHSNGAVLTVAENKDGEMIGIIKVKGKQAATISTSSGVPVVRYISGAFES
ncbi:MAG: hypothetical protein H7A09_07810, partial [Oceanospirillaceae bacterium]|nr:hypothetical protein [Oceanospirillaceae bacterium]